jgi:hypothetical protein
MANTKFKIGDLVKLKSGGAVMVVSDIIVYEAWEEQEFDSEEGEFIGEITKYPERIELWCSWQDTDDRPHRIAYDPQILVKA